MPALPPAIIMGGTMGAAISVARSLGRLGVDVYLLGDRESLERHSRYIQLVQLSQGDEEAEVWAEYLLSPDSDPLRGAILLACSDSGIETIIKYRERLARKYVLDISDPAAQAAILNKLSTYRIAEEAGVPTPLYWVADTAEHVRAKKDDFVYPLIVKPLYSHKLVAVFDRKFLVADDFDQLMAAYDEVSRLGVEVLLLEKIPGPDDRLCSYFTYIDEGGRPLFHFTKRVVRRYPENEGLGCYHVTDWNPEVRDLGLRFLTSAGLLGLGNVEFKRDDRDGKLKVIECNARFTAANPLLSASGYDLGIFVYNRLAGRPQSTLMGKEYSIGLHLWHPARDAAAFLELRARRGLSLRSWVSSLLHRQVLVYFRWYDPLPSIASLTRLPTRWIGYRKRRSASRLDNR